MKILDKLKFNRDKKKTNRIYRKNLDKNNNEINNVKNSKQIQKEQKSLNIRYNLIIITLYIAAAILLIQLFNMQILNGLNYREQSNTRLTKEVSIEPTRGTIMDRTGIPYASTELNYSVELHKLKSDDEALNKLGKTLIGILKKNNEEYDISLPLDLKNMKYKQMSGEDLRKWKLKNKVPEQASPQEAFDILKQNYRVEETDKEIASNILEFRDLLNERKYNNFEALKIAKNIKKDTAIEISEKSYKLPGINIISKPKRNYLKGEEASHIIGYIGKINEKEYESKKEAKNTEYRNDDFIGKTGIEKTFEKVLKGVRGKKQIDINIQGGVTGEYTIKEAVGGASVVLTIDSKLQKVTEQSLERTIKKLRQGGFENKKQNAKGGSTVVMNVKTGEILAMASYPQYDVNRFKDGISNKDWNEYANNPLAPLVNRSISTIYAPGSTFKMITALTGLNEGKIGLREIINDTGIYPKAHRPKCWIYLYHGIGHGRLNVIGAIKNSCNYFFYEVGNRVGSDKISEYAKYFGLGVKTGVELEGEKTGELANKQTAEKKGEVWTQGGELSAAIGQSYNSFTPIQMAKYISMIANGGKVIHPTLIKSIKQANGTSLSQEEIDKILEETLGYKKEKVEDKQIKKEYIDAVLEGMRAVTGESGGTAYSVFRNFKVEVGGKTGTAQVGQNRTDGLFVGFAPFDSPEIGIVTVIENAGEGHYTAEVVRDIMKEYFGMNIKHIKENMNLNKEGEFII